MEEQNQNLEQESKIQRDYIPIPHEELVENKKSWKLILGIVVILSLILLGAGIYWTLNDAETIVENKKVNKINQDEKIVLDTKENNINWNEIIDYQWAFSMSFPPEMKVYKSDDNSDFSSSFRSEDGESFYMSIGGSDIIFDLSNPNSYKPFVDLIEADEKTSGGEIIIINDRYLYNYIMKYPEEYGLGMKEYYLLMKDDYVYNTSFLLNEAENIEEQQLNNRRIMDTLKFFKPAARGLDSQISKYTQGVGLSTVVLEGELTEDRALYPEYSNYNIRNEDNVIVNYINTVYGQIVVYYKDKLTCPKNISIKGNLYRLSPRWATDREAYGYYMDLIDYECVDLNLDIIINSNLETNYEDLLVYNNPSLDFIMKYPSEYTIHTETDVSHDDNPEEGVSFMEVKDEGNYSYISIVKSENTLEEENINNLEELGIFLEVVENYKIEKNIAINGKLFMRYTNYLHNNYFMQVYYTIINNELYVLTFSVFRLDINSEDIEVQKDFARSIIETFELK